MCCVRLHTLVLIDVGHSPAACMSQSFLFSLPVTPIGLNTSRSTCAGHMHGGQESGYKACRNPGTTSRSQGWSVFELPRAWSPGLIAGEVGEGTWHTLALWPPLLPLTMPMHLLQSHASAPLGQDYMICKAFHHLEMLGYRVSQRAHIPHSLVS